MDDAATTRLIADELAVRELAAAYTDAVNRGDLDGMVIVYAEDGVLIPFGGAEYRGRAAIREVIAQSTGGFEWIFQMTHSGLVELDGDRARCRWWISETGYRSDGPASQFYGLYQDTVVRTHEGWRFACRRLDATFMGKMSLQGKHPERPTYLPVTWGKT